MDKEHLILRPAEYAHQNIDNYSIVDSSNVRGGRRTVSSVYQMYNIPDDKLSENVSIVYVENENKEYRLINLSNKSNSSGWVELKYGSDAPAKIETKGAIKKTTSGDTVTLDLPVALNSGLNTNPLGIKIAESSSDYLTVNQNGLNFNTAAITSAVSGQIKDIQAQIDAKQDILNSSNTINIDYYDNSKLKVVINPDSTEKYLIETAKGLDTNIQPALDKKADLINGMVPASQLPSYIDDIRNLTYMEASEPGGVTGQALGELYYNTSSNALFEWKSVTPEGETSAVTQWVQVQPSATTIYLYTGSEPYTQWRWVENPGVLQKINQDLSWTNGICTNHVVNGSTQEIDLNLLQDDFLLTAKNNILQSKPVNEWDIFGENLTYNEVTGKIDSANTSYTAGDGIAIEDNAIRRKDVATSASAVQNTYTVNFSYPLQTVSNVNSNIALKLPTVDGSFTGPTDGETKTVIVQMYNKASSSITVTLPTTLSGASVYNMYSKPNLILMPQQLGELWVTATSNTVTIKVFTSYVDITESSYINFPESEYYSFVYDDSKLSTLKVGDTFTFQVQMADEFKVFKGITLTDEQGQPLQFTLNGTYVTIPQVSKQVNIVVDYTKRFTLTLTATEGGSVTGDGVYDENESATIQAIPDNGYYFKKWSDEDVNSNRSITITQDISLQAIFDTLKQITFSQMNNCQVQTEPSAQIPGNTVIFTLVPVDSSFNYQGVYIHDANSNEISYTEVVHEDNTVTIQFVMPDTDVDVQASYVASYSITVVESQNGTTNVQSTAIANEEVAISFVPNTGYTDSPTITIINVTTGEELPYSVSKVGDVTFVMPESDVNITTIFNSISIGEAVDLGLPSGLLWANMNIGATAPEEYGNYYAWGETETKDTYTWDNYKYGTQDNLTKYNATDGLTILDAGDDAATVNWGGTWRMPTNKELTELADNCTWLWTTMNGVNGYSVRSKTNSNSIFFPAAGLRILSDLSSVGSYGRYWSSSLDTNNLDRAPHLGFYSEGKAYGYSLRNYGFSIRPVKTPQPTTQIYYNATEDLSTSIGDLSSRVKLVTDSCTYDSVTGDGVLSYDSDVTEIPSTYFRNKSNIRTISFPNSVTSIADGAAFYGCSSLTSVTIPNSLTNIGDGAFRYCRSLIYVIMGNSVQNIGTEAFCDCSSLTEITLPNSLTNIGYQAFLGCSSLTQVTIPNLVTSISDGTFRNCSSLTSVTIDNSVTSIGKYAFSDCSKLTSITYKGTIEQWNAITKGTNWNLNVLATEVICTNGNVDINL